MEFNAAEMEIWRGRNGKLTWQKKKFDVAEMEKLMQQKWKT